MEKKAQQKCFNYIDANMHMIVERRKEKHNLVDTKSKKSNAYMIQEMQEGWWIELEKHLFIYSYHYVLHLVK